MCGRFSHLYKWRDLHYLYSLLSEPIEFAPSYNVAPTQSVPVVVQRGDSRDLEMLRWGLVPTWASDLKIGNSLINARAETVASKPAFRAAFKSRRCIVPVSGFYEWQRLDGGKSKQPFYIHASDHAPLSLAGLWEQWTPTPPAPGREPLRTFTIITTAANELMSKLHDRMPVILEQTAFAQWLDVKSSAEQLSRLLRPYPSDRLAAIAVSTIVNSPRNNGPECLSPAA